MREDLDIDAWREALLAMEKALRAGESSRNEAASTVELDQQRTGRLTRMDALQSQAMANAAKSRAEDGLRRVAVALARIDSGDFGYCARCDEPIAEGRLRADPATPLCIACASAAERP